MANNPYVPKPEDMVHAEDYYGADIVTEASYEVQGIPTQAQRFEDMYDDGKEEIVEVPEVQKTLDLRSVNGILQQKEIHTVSLLNLKTVESVLKSKEEKWIAVPRFYTDTNGNLVS